MADASLMYEVLLYLESFYFALLACTEIGTIALKSVNMRMNFEEMQMDCIMMAIVLTLIAVRVYLGRRGCLADRDWTVIASAILTVPCMLGVLYLIFKQYRIVRLELVLCWLMLALHATELSYAIKFAYSTCQPVTYT